MAKDSHANGVDEEYKDAIQPVIDDRMRTDILGPHLLKVLKEHKPTSQEIVSLIAQEMAANPELKKSIKGVVEEYNKETRIRWVDRAFGVLGTAILALLIWGIEHLIAKK